jgi:hypothetical protein
MQHEERINVLENQVRTLKRIVCLVCCSFVGACFTGCQSDSCVEKIQLQVQVDNQIRKESDQERESSSSQITKENEVRKESDIEEDSGHGIFPGGIPGGNYMPGGHPPRSTWVMEKKDMGSGSQLAPMQKIIANWYPESPSSHPKEMYLLCETNGVYTMNYWDDPEQDHSGKYWWHPVNVASSRSITSHMDLTNGSKLIITLIDPNTKPQPISSFRPNGNFWKTNSVGDLEIWNSNDVIETITNFENYSKSD